MNKINEVTSSLPERSSYSSLPGRPLSDSLSEERGVILRLPTVGGGRMYLVFCLVPCFVLIPAFFAVLIRVFLAKCLENNCSLLYKWYSKISEFLSRQSLDLKLAGNQVFYRCYCFCYSVPFSFNFPIINIAQPCCTFSKQILLGSISCR